MITRLIAKQWSRSVQSGLKSVTRLCHDSSSPSESYTSPADHFPQLVGKIAGTVTNRLLPFGHIEAKNMIIGHNQGITENIRNLLNTDHFNWEHSPGDAFKAAFNSLADGANLEDVAEFYKMFPTIILDLKASEVCQRTPVVGDRLEQILVFQSSPSAQFSACIALASHKHFNSISDKSESSAKNKKQLELACVLAWCSEMIHRSYTLHDDIVDGSSVRYGRPTWHEVNGEGAIRSLNDVLLVERAAVDLIRLHFQDQPLVCAQLQDLLSHVLQSYTYGNAWEQAMETHFQKSGALPTLDEYITMAGVQNGSYHGENDPSSMKALECASFAVMVVGSMARDYMDIYLDLDQMGNEATDIYNGSMSWPIITAMKHGNANQKRILQENYGKKVKENLKNVRDVYEEIGIRRRFKEWEAIYYDRTSEIIRNLSPTLPRDQIHSILDVARNQFLPYI